MTGAAGFFPWGLGGGEARSSETATNGVIQTAEENDNRENASPDAFDLIELHSRWFGDGNHQAVTPPTESKAPAEHKEPVREQASVVYRIIKSDQKVEQDVPDPARAEHHESHHGTIAATLARAEQVLEQLPDLPHLPHHSRLQASLSALEVALAGMRLSDLEAALAGHEAPEKKEAT